MTIIDKIKESVTLATGLEFHYDTPQTLNRTLDTAQFPCAMLDILNSGTAIEENGIICERLTIEVLFAAKSDFDFDGEKVEADELDAMKRKAFVWVLSLLRSRTLKLVSALETHRYYATNDAIYSAFGVTVTIDERKGVTVCDIE